MNKMTDEQIIKALECCVNWGGTTSCADCPFHNTGCLHFNKLKEVLDLIDRQKAEIERLDKEVDRLSQVVLYNDGVTEMKVEEAKAEAVKEFAERLKVECSGNPYLDDDVIQHYIDNILKEMEKGKNNYV